MIADDIKRVLIAGSGNMGQQIGFLCATNGFETVLYDTDSDILSDAVSRILKLSKSYVRAGRMTIEEAEAALDRISITHTPEEAAKKIDLISESVPEDPELKGKVLGMFNKLCPEHTVFTTNTSTLVPSMFAEATGRPEKFAAFHFHDVRITNIVDIMPHPGTSPETTELIKCFAEKIGQVPIVLHKENNGYVFNSMLSNLFTSALTLAEKNIASVNDIDRAWMGVMHTVIGPFGIMDQVGLKTVYTITDYWAKTHNDSQFKANAVYLKQMVDKGYLGAQSRQGFYTYPDPDYLQPDFLKGKAK
ncbi:MAG: 3-hydroxyacyl-CoA dehydrogenase [Deltaproteobacteria bacterium]|nr:3-hydroxyacyl-CoA dehydrogenase [Deltaproteobacteria bacterium]MBW2219147.1 3-hydroxyacyl-CoA dehydrogenase [Deltaproteobacteria bacterium]